MVEIDCIVFKPVVIVLMNIDAILPQCRCKHEDSTIVMNPWSRLPTISAHCVRIVHFIHFRKFQTLMTFKLTEKPENAVAGRHTQHLSPHLVGCHVRLGLSVTPLTVVVEVRGGGCGAPRRLSSRVGRNMLFFVPTKLVRYKEGGT